MNDDPIMLTAPGRLRDIELAAMRAYRAKYPDGPPWLELAITTRGAWIDHVDAVVFREPSGACFTSRDSRKVVTFPYWPKTEYVDVPAGA